MKLKIFYVYAVQSAMAAITAISTSAVAGCRLSDGTFHAGAPKFVCNNLDNTLRRDYFAKCKKWKNEWGDKPECCTNCQANWKTCIDECKAFIHLTPPELDGFSCDQLEAPSNGHIFCSAGFRTGTTCLAFCDNGFSLSPRGKKRCKPRGNWQKTAGSKSPVRWNLKSQDFTCTKEYQPSACSTNNGGCSHHCVDRGDGDARCVCPCGYKLDLSDRKTCILERDVCPLDISFLVDQSSSVCSDSQFQEDQGNDIKQILSFLRSEVNSRNAKLGLGLYSAGTVSNVITTLNSENTNMTEVMDNFESAYSNLDCGSNQVGNIFSEFSENGRDDDVPVTKVTILTVGNDVTDTNDQLLSSRPSEGKVIVLKNGQITSSSYETQVDILGCEGDADCDSSLEIGNFGAADIEQLVSRNECYQGFYSSSISCTEFNLQLKIPKCALKGLELMDVIFNDPDNCNMITGDDGRFFTWTIDYNDCGTVKNVNSTRGNSTEIFPNALAGVVGGALASTSTEGLIAYSNRLRTKIDETGSVFPILPVFDVPLQCDLHTTYDFTFEEDWFPKLSSYNATIDAHYDLEGDMKLFHDSSFTQEFNGTTGIANGINIYVQSTMEVPAEYSPDAVIIDSCVASPGPLEELRPVNAGDPFWMLIDSGCINDHTVQVLPRGDNGEVRFTFEGFAFHTFEEDPINIQCRFRTCNQSTETCSDTLPMCSRRR
jgi:hypothetical protein